MKELLEVRKKLKAKKPKFLRRDYYKKKRVSRNWRKPKGLQNKMRLKKRGYHRVVSVGWGSPTKVRGLHSSGLEPVIISNVAQLESLKENQGIIVSARLGNKKRVMILEAAKKQGVKVLNLDVAKHLEKIKETLEAKKKAKQERAAKKKAKEVKVKEEKKEEKKEVDVEKKKEEEKKELDKTLTKKV